MGLCVHYCASIFGVIGLTTALALELAPKVQVEFFCPELIDTSTMDAEFEWFGDPVETRKAAISRVPMKHFATPQEIADSILFFATSAHDATGSVFSIDGGAIVI